MSYRLKRRLFQAVMIIPMFILLGVRWLGMTAEDQLLWLLQTEMRLAFQEFQAQARAARQEGGLPHDTTGACTSEPTTLPPAE